jgi:TRAP-type C4-dicarboxylate transport system substrate-binding protein
MEKSKKAIVPICTCLVFAVAALTFTFSPAMCGSSEAVEIKLKYGSYAPQSTIDEPILWYVDEVSKKTGVKIDVETYFGGILAKPADCLDAIGKGVYQLGWISPAFTPGKTPLAMIPNSTPLVVPSLFSGLKAADEAVQKSHALAAEFQNSNLKYLFHTGVWHYQLISTKPVKSLEDIKGLRVRTFGYLSKAWAELGGVPVTMSIPEAYDALQKGVIDGVLTQPYSCYKGLRLYEVAKHFTRMDFGCLPTPVLMNLDTWKKLPEKVQQEMLKLAGDMPSIIDKKITDQENAAIEAMKNEGITIYELSAEDKARKNEAAKVVTKMVVDDLTAKGVTDAKEIMDIFLTAIEKYSR